MEKSRFEFGTYVGGVVVFFTVFTESATSAAYDTEYSVSSFASLVLSLDPSHPVLLGEESLEQNVFVEHTPESVGTNMEELAQMEE